MARQQLSLISFIVSAALAGCESPEQAAPTPGTVHEPSVRVADVPVGHWFCDMGTVEYSRAEKGDGKCPVCGMDLVPKTSADQETAHPKMLKKMLEKQGDGPAGAQPAAE